MDHLDLFSGIGGFALGLGWAGFNTVAFCEIDKYCQGVLRKNFPGVKIHEDIKELNGNEYKGIGIITGGYPCQPFSQAGQRKGEKDDRHLWPEMFRVIAQARPSWVILENVYGHISMGLDTVLLDMENEGYATRTFVVPACAVNAPHRRDRLWILCANTDNDTSAQQKSQHKRAKNNKGGFGDKLDARKVVANSSSERRQQDSRGSHGNESQDEGRLKKNNHKFKRDVQSDRTEEIPRALANPNGERELQQKRAIEKLRGWSSYSDEEIRGNWSDEPTVARMVYGIPNRVDRIKGLGNAVVPQIPYLIGKSIIECK